jgi:hypothetical protein
LCHSRAAFPSSLILPFGGIVFVGHTKLSTIEGFLFTVPREIEFLPGFAATFSSPLVAGQDDLHPIPSPSFQATHFDFA